jgi:beta-N-acetylhexosaminidase
MRLLRIAPLFFALVLFPACMGKNTTAPESAVAAAVDERYIAIQYTASLIAASLDDRQLAAQVIICGIDGKGHLTDGMKILLAECPAGGVMLFRYNLDTDNDAIQSLIAETVALIESGSGVPPFVAVDHEGGTVNRFKDGVADLPSAASYGSFAAERITADSFKAGTAMNALGINLNFAPVAEYITADNRDFLADRSYGTDPEYVTEAAAAFIAGMEQAGILCVIKHFPGSAGADPHFFPAALTGDKEALAELVSPFAALIYGGNVRAIMVAHSAVPAWDNVIASLSPAVMGTWLRQELGFDGIIICDDFSMTSARSPASAGGPASADIKPETAAVQSLAAGSDMVLVWPPDIRRTHRAIMTALENGDLSRERLQDAAERIMVEKIRLELLELIDE